MDSHNELFELSQTLANAAALGDDPNVAKEMTAVVDAAQRVGRSFSGSWLGYHAYVYYADFASPPPGRHFSQEWGMGDRFAGMGSKGDWVQYDPQKVKDYILAEAGNPDLTGARDAETSARKTFGRARSETLSIIGTELNSEDDPFLQKLQERLEGLELMSPSDVAEIWRPKAQIMTRDTIALGQGTKAPPHIAAHADIASLQQTFAICAEAAEIAAKAASHLERKSKKARKVSRVGTNVFIGHGRSPAWRELKDFVQDRLSLPWDEFNRVPVAGVTNVARLSEMLDSAAIAFLVMTAEDERQTGASGLVKTSCMRRDCFRGA